MKNTAAFLTLLLVFCVHPLKAQTGPSDDSTKAQECVQQHADSDAAFVGRFIPANLWETKIPWFGKPYFRISALSGDRKYELKTDPKVVLVDGQPPCRCIEVKFAREHGKLTNKIAELVENNPRNEEHCESLEPHTD